MNGVSRIDSFQPNAKQLQFCVSTATESFLTGPNQWGGKTYTLRFLIAVWATGRYPEGWTGRRFDTPPMIFVLSKTMEINQRHIWDHLFSDHFEMEGQHGDPWIDPGDYADADLDIKGKLLHSAKIDHRGPDGLCNGKSVIYSLSYDMGWKSVAGFTADIVVGNETPPMPVYTEMKARINVGGLSARASGGGILRIGACPLEEEPDVYYHFEDTADGKHMELISYTIDDCTHLTPEEYEDAMARWKNHPEAEARLYGRPCRAGGIVFPYSYQDITCPPASSLIGKKGLIGLDLPHGVGHFAALLATYDDINDVVTVHKEFKAEGEEIPLNARRVALMGGDTIPVVWPHDGKVRHGDTGEAIVEKYRKCGLNMLRDHAHFYDGAKKSKAKMPMVAEAQDRFATGRLKISTLCPQLLREIQKWRFKRGEIIKHQDDHLIDALIKILMMLRYAEPIGSPKPKPIIRKGDYDFYALVGP